MNLMSHTGSNNSIGTVTATVVVLISTEHQQVRVCSSSSVPSSAAAPSTVWQGLLWQQGTKNASKSTPPQVQGSVGRLGSFLGTPVSSSLYVGGQAQLLPGALWEENCLRVSSTPAASALLTKADLPGPSPPCAPDPRPLSSSGGSLQQLSSRPLLFI